MRQIDEDLYRIIRDLQRRIERLERDDRPKYLNGSKAWNPPSLATNAEQSTTVTVTGAENGDIVLPPSFTEGLQGTELFGEVTAADTVTVWHYNASAGVVDLAEGTLRVRVLKL